LKKGFKREKKRSQMTNEYLFVFFYVKGSDLK